MRIRRVSHGHGPRPPRNGMSTIQMMGAALLLLSRSGRGSDNNKQPANCNRDKFASFFVAVIKKETTSRARTGGRIKGKGQGGVNLRWGRCHCCCCCWQACQGGMRALLNQRSPPELTMSFWQAAFNDVAAGVDVDVAVAAQGVC